LPGVLLPADLPFTTPAPVPEDPGSPGNSQLAQRGRNLARASSGHTPAARPATPTQPQLRSTLSTSFDTNAHPDPSASTLSRQDPRQPAVIDARTSKTPDQDENSSHASNEDHGKERRRRRANPINAARRIDGQRPRRLQRARAARTVRGAAGGAALRAGRARQHGRFPAVRVSAEWVAGVDVHLPQHVCRSGTSTLTPSRRSSAAVALPACGTRPSTRHVTKSPTFVPARLVPGG
jgi:hypothetical protein